MVKVTVVIDLEPGKEALKDLVDTLESCESIILFEIKKIGKE
jgi:hypothetical protein